MNSTALHLMSLSGVAALALSPEPQQFALWGVVITSVAGIITNYVNRREDRKRIEQEHAWQREERTDREKYRRESLEGIQQTAQIAAATKEELKSAIAENTTITIESAVKAAAAIDEANHVTEKLEGVKRLITDRR